MDILLITTSGGDTYLDLDLADYVSPAANFSNALTGFNITELTSAYGATAKLYKPGETSPLTTVSAATGSGVNFGYTEPEPGDVIYKLEVTDDLGRKSKYNLPRKWINYAMETTSTPGFQKFVLEGIENDYTTTVTLPNLSSSSTAKVYRTSDHGYMGIKFKIQGRNAPSDDWVDIANADEDDEVLAFGDYLYHRVWVKPTAKATTTVSSSNVVTLTLSNVTENVTTSFTGADPFDINETTNVFVFEETTKVGTVPYTVTVGTETYTNAVTATTEGTAYDYVTLAFANPTLRLTTSNVTISSAKLYRDDVLFHTYGTESNVVLRSDQTGTYQAIVNDVYYSNRITPDFTTTRSVSAPQLGFDGYNKLHLSNITPTSTTLGLPDGTTRDLTTQSNVYIYKSGTYTANVQTSDTFAYLSNVVNNVYYGDIQSPYFTDASTIVTDSNWSSSTGFEITESSVGASQPGYQAFDNTYTAANSYESTWLSAASSGMPAWIQIQYPQDVVIKSYTIVGRDDTDRYYPTSWQLQGATAAAPSTYVNLETTSGNRTASSWAPLAEVSHDVNSSNTAYRYFRLYVNSSNEGGQVSINELKLFTTPLSGQISVTSKPKLTFDGFNKLAISNITQTSSTITYPNGSTVSTNTVSDVYIKDIGEYVLEASDANTFVTSNVEVGAVDTVPGFTAAFHHGAFSASDYSSAYSTVAEAATAGFVYSDTPAGDYTWGALAHVKERENPDFTANSTLHTDYSSTYGWNDDDGWEVSAKDEFSNGSYPVWKAFSKTYASNNNWLSGSAPSTSSPQWIKIKYPSSQVIKSYVIRARENASPRWPTAWKLQGSNNDSDWTDIGSEQTQTEWVPNQNKSFDLSTNTTAYQYYRLRITGAKESASSDNSDYVAIGHWFLLTETSGSTVHTKYTRYTYTPPASTITANVLRVAGGGGGSGTRGGGGGAGGLLYSENVSLSGTKSIVVGNGGIGYEGTQQSIENGYDTVFTGLTTSIGGGHGGGNDAIIPTPGGSGGGGSARIAAVGTGAAGTSGQGNAGGNGSTGDDFNGGGGGGAGGVGGNSGGVGGVGLDYSSVFGTTYGVSGFFAGGGGGGNSSGGNTGGNGGGGGGSNGHGTKHTGGGGAGIGNGSSTSGDGGSGIVLIKKLGATNPPALNFDGYNKLSIDNVLSSTSYPDNLYHNVGYWAGTNPVHYHKLDTTQSNETSKLYELWQSSLIGNSFGIGFYNVDNTTVLKVNEGDNTGQPSYFKINGSGSHESHAIEVGDVIQLWGTNHEGGFTVTEDLLFPTSIEVTIKKDGAAFATTTSNTVYIRDTGTYTAEVKGSGAYVTEVSKVVTGNIQQIPARILLEDGTIQYSAHAHQNSEPAHNGVMPYSNGKWNNSPTSGHYSFTIVNGYEMKCVDNSHILADPTYFTVDKYTGNFSMTLPKHGANATGNIPVIPPSPSLTYDNYNKITLNQLNYADTSIVTYYSNTYNLGTAKTMYVKDEGEYVFKISGTDKYVESNVHVSSVDLAGAPTKPIDFDGYNKLTLVDAGSNVSANVTYFSNTYELGSANVFYINGAGTYDLEMSGSNVFALSNTFVNAISTPDVSGTHRFLLDSGTLTDSNNGSLAFDSGATFEAPELRKDAKTSYKLSVGQNKNVTLPSALSNWCVSMWVFIPYVTSYGSSNSNDIPSDFSSYTHNFGYSWSYPWIWHMANGREFRHRTVHDSHIYEYASASATSSSGNNMYHSWGSSIGSSSKQEWHPGNSSNNAFMPEAWHHMAWEYNGTTGVMKWYCDGIERTTAEVTMTTGCSLSGMTFGDNTPNGSLSTDGGTNSGNPYWYISDLVIAPSWNINTYNLTKGTYKHFLPIPQTLSVRQLRGEGTETSVSTPSLTFDTYNKLTLENFTTVNKQWPPTDGTRSSPTWSDSDKVADWTITGASYGNGSYKATSSVDVWNVNGNHAGPYWAFNNDDSTASNECWHPQSIVASILTIEMPSSMVLGSYELYYRNYTDYTCSPKDWTIEGSNDGITWTVLDTRTNQSQVSANLAKIGTYIVSNSTSYSKYRLNVTENNGGDQTIVGEWKLFQDTRTTKLTDPNGDTYSLGQTQNDIYIKDQGDYFLEVTNSDQSAVVTKSVTGTLSASPGTPSITSILVTRNNGSDYTEASPSTERNGAWESRFVDGNAGTVEMDGSGTNGIGFSMYLNFDQTFTVNTAVFKMISTYQTYKDISFRCGVSDSDYITVDPGGLNFASTQTITFTFSSPITVNKLYFAVNQDNGNDLYNIRMSSGDIIINDVAYALSDSDKVLPSPVLTFDNYNKLSIENITPTSTTLTDPNGSSFDIGTASNVYIEDEGTYKMATGDATTFALVSKQVNTLALKPDYTNIYAGEYGGMVIDSDGKLYTWGNDGNNQSGRGASDRTPTHISTISDPVSNVWVEGAAGRTRIVKTSTDKWYMWGMNLDKYKIFGQTGDQATPVDVTSDFTTYFGAQGTSDSTRIIKVVTSASACSALAADGKVWSWGVDGNRNELGKNTTNGTTATPFKNTTDGTAELSNITDICCLLYGKLALDSNGDVWQWGTLGTGSTGYPTKQTGLTLGPQTINSTYGTSPNGRYLKYHSEDTTHYKYGIWDGPASRWLSWDVSFENNITLIKVGKIGQSDNNTWTDATSSGDPTNVVDNNTGTVYFDFNSTTYSFTKPTTASWIGSGYINIIGIGAGYFTAYAWDAAGTIYSIGQGTEGQLGNGANSDQDSSWQTVTTLQGKTIYGIYGAGYSVFAHTSDGVYACGQGTNGRLGMGNNDDLNVFTKSTTLSALSIYKMDFGHGPSYIITTDGKGYALGYDYLNSIPTPLSGDKNVPTEASSLTNLSLVYQPPSLTYDTSNKLSIENLTPTSTTLTDPNGSSFDIGTASNVYIRDSGKYSIASKDANTFVLTSNTVTGTPTGTTYVYDSNTFTTPSQTYDNTKTITVTNVPSTLTDVVGKIYKGSTAYTIHATTSSSNVIIKNTGTYVSVFTTATQAFLTNAVNVNATPTTTSDDNYD